MKIIDTFNGLAWLGRNGQNLTALLEAAQNYKDKESRQDVQRRLDLEQINNVRMEYQDLMKNLDIVSGYLRDVIVNKLK